MGLWGGVKSFFGGKTTTTSQTLDPASQKYVDAMRGQAQGASNVALGGPAGGGSWFTGPQTQTIGQQAGAFMNPYMQNVIDPMNAYFDKQRQQAMTNTSAQATMGGAYGGSRAAVLAGSRLGELDAAQGQQMGGLLAGGYQNAMQQGTAYAEQQRQLQQQQMQEPLFRQQQAQAFQQGGMGPVGWNQTQKTSGGQFGDIMKFGAGLGMTAMGAGLFGGGGGGGGGGMQTMGGGYQNAPNLNWNPQYQNPYQR